MKNLSVEKMEKIEGGYISPEALFGLFCGVNFLIAAQGTDSAVRTILYSLYQDAGC